MNIFFWLRLQVWLTLLLLSISGQARPLVEKSEFKNSSYNDQIKTYEEDEIAAKIEALEEAMSDLIGQIEQQSHSIEVLESKIKSIGGDDVGKSLIKSGSKGSRNTKIAYKGREKSSIGIESLYNTMLQDLSQKKYTEAEQGCLKILHDFPDTAQANMAYFWLGEMKMLYGNHVDARKYFNSALDKVPNHKKAADILLKLAVIAYEAKDYSLGDKYVVRLQKDYPQATATHLARAQKRKYLNERSGQ